MGRHDSFPKGGKIKKNFAYEFTFNPISLFLLIFLEYWRWKAILLIKFKLIFGINM
jgi:hypothetical protein